MPRPLSPGRRAAIGAVLLALTCAALAGLALWLTAPPSFQAVRRAYAPSEAYLLDRHGALLETQRVDFGVRRLAWTGLSEISPALIDAVLDGEDRRFWSHGGIDWLGIAGALRDALLLHRRRGASTITMQLATLLQSQRGEAQDAHGLMHKLHQARVALGIELHWSKQQILEAYLNLVPVRGELQGIAAATQVLVHKAPAGLTLAESRAIAALLPNPAAPPQRVAERACARLAPAERSASCPALREAITRLLAVTPEDSSTPRLAPQLARSLLQRPGQIVRTTLDRELQGLALQALSRQLAALAERNVRDGAALVVDNASGDVLAYVASAGTSSHAAQVDGVRAPRQAGSTLKPFLYELALEHRYLTAASLLEDSPVDIKTPGGLYLPQDYDHEYKGIVSVRTALAGSLNVPAVRTLMLMGVETFRDRLRALGYAGLTQEGDYYGYALALGSAEVTLWQQAAAYRALARGGVLDELHVRADAPAGATRFALSPAASFIVADILSDKAARAVTFGLNSSLATPYWSAVKTGTSKDMRDNWCIGFTARYTVAVWVGNFEGDAMHDVSGVSGAAPAWREIMDALQAGEAGGAPGEPPAGLAHAPVRFAAQLEPPRREWFLAGTVPSQPVTALSAQARRPHFSSPTDGMVIALDPDIPPGRQRIPIQVEGGLAPLQVRLNDTMLGSTPEGLLWAPQPGSYRLALQDARGTVLDQIHVTVR